MANVQNKQVFAPIYFKGGEFVWRIKSGDRGVGYTNSGPGIRDCRYGVMYVVPREYVFHRRPTAEYVERCVIKYFGLVLERKKVDPEEEIQWVKTI